MEKELSRQTNAENDRFENTGIRTRVIREICSLAQDNQVEKVILFGSRARGDFKERSDIDLAFHGGNGSEFASAVDEQTYTLLKFDVVDLDLPIQRELREKIEEEGKVLYEKI